MSVTKERNDLNVYQCLKVKMEVLVEQVESTLETMPISVPVLKIRVESTKEAWGEFEQQYDKMCNATGDKRVADQVWAQEDHAQYANFQRRYYQALARADNALINDEQRRQDKQNAEDARLKALAMKEEACLKALAKEEEARLKMLASEEEARIKANKVQQLSAKWKVIHQHIETILDEIKTRLEGDPIDSLELLKVKSNQLMAVKEYLGESASLMDSMFDEDPEQMVVTMEAEATKKTQADSKIRACEEQLAKFQAAINASKVSSTEAATPAVTEAPTAPTMRPTPMGPRFER